jgi:AcrR family transcriptional regulator
MPSRRLSRSRLEPRRSPTQPQAVQTVAAMLDATIQLLSQRGLEGFNTNAVATRAGVSIGSLYQYFPNKDALMAAVIEREQARRLQEITVVLADNIGLAEAIRAIMDLAAGPGRHDAARHRLHIALDHEEARLPLPRLRAIAEQLDHHIALRLQQRLPHITMAELLRSARTLRVMMRAISDDRPDRSDPTAVEEVVAATLGYLHHRFGLASQP